MDEDRAQKYGGTSLDKCIEQMTKEKMIGTILDTMKIMGDRKMFLSEAYWVPAFDLIVREGTEEEFERFASALALIHGGSNPGVPVFVPVNDVLEVITKRGLPWLPRIMDVVHVDSRTLLWARAIRDDYPHLEELCEILQGSEGFSMFNINDIVSTLAGTSNSIAKLEQWAPLAMDWDFLNAGEDYWRKFMTCALYKKDVSLAKALLEKTHDTEIVSFVLSAWRHFYTCGDLLPYTLDLVADKIREHRMGEGARELKKIARRYMARCRKDATEPDPTVLAHLNKPAVKGAL